MDSTPDAVVSPSDARLLPGSFRQTSDLFIKDKFFKFEEMFGNDKSIWKKAFTGGDFAMLRLTPDKYHRNHVPAAGVVRDIYEIDGAYQSCHPAVVVAQATPYSKNRRTITIIDTDVPDGSQTGLVAMIEVVALMIGDIVQCYSEDRYNNPAPLRTGMHIRRGCPKSLFRPGSSTVVLIFQPGRIRFCDTILANFRRPGVTTAFSTAWGNPMAEIDVPVRSTIAHAIRGD
jgi:phosphatidylserine decarboxylase